MKILPIRSHENLSQIIRIPVYGLKIVGLAPFSLRKTNSSTRISRDSRCTSIFVFSKIGLAYNILLSIVVLVIGALGVSRISSVKYAKKSPLTQAIDISTGILRILTSCIIIVSGALKQNKAISIMNRLLKVDCLLSGMKKHPGSKRTSFKFLPMHMILNVLLWITFWVSEKAYVKSFLYGFIANVPIFVIHWFVLEYSIVLRIVGGELKNFNKILSNFEEFPNYLFRTPILNNKNVAVVRLPTQCSQLAALRLLHDICITLAEVCEDVADFFSFPTLPTIACLSVAIVYNFYYLIIPVIPIISDFDISTDISAIAWILVCVYPIIILTFNVTEILKEAKLTGLILHKVLARTTRPEIQAELKQFSLQLMHEDISFTAYGFFALDFTLIKSILGTTATYIFIIIQFARSAADT